MAGSETYSPGLEGIIAGETATSTVEGGLRYRGYPVSQLAELCSFEEVAYLLVFGELPTKTELAAFCAEMVAARNLPEPLTALQKSLPGGVSPMDEVRTAVSVLAHFDPECEDESPAAMRRMTTRLLGRVPLAVASQFHASRKRPMPAPRSDLGHAAHFLYLIHGKEAKPEDVKAFDVSLILYAEHEFNASTFAARVVTSTEADLYSAIVAAIGALKGKLHGGANERVMDVLRAAGGPDTAEKWLRAALMKKERIMGFGHRVYKTGDVRAGILKEYATAASQRSGLMKWEETAEIFERVIAHEKNLYPNLDWPAGRLYNALGLEVPVYTPIFVMSRITGWAAHVIEQRSANRLIRPRGLYTGPAERAVKALAQRS